MINHEEKARQLFLEGYNCAQSVFAAFCDEMNMDRELALRLSSSFGGGMGRMREVCGALSGMFMVIGVLYGYNNPGDDQIKAAHYARIQELAKRFRETNGSIICRELLELPEGDVSPVPTVRDKAFYERRPCLEYVADAARLTDEYITQSRI